MTSTQTRSTLSVENGWVRADGTTLGADDGIGLALILALLMAEDVSHGRLEALFTVNEEDGFTGADAIQPGVLQGNLLINVDSEEEGAFTIGSAGGVNVDGSATFPLEAVPAGMVGVRLVVEGLKGGHSGIDINRGRGNAIKLLARLLNGAEDQFDLRLSSMSGGDRYNAIPRETAAVIALPEANMRPLADYVAAFATTVGQELAAADPEVRISAVATDLPALAIAPDAQRALIDALHACPNGVMRMSDSVPDLVETSTNLGMANLADDQLTLGFLVRSAIDSERDDVRQMIESVLALAGIAATHHGDYSGWKPNPESPLVELMLSTYRDLFGSDATLMAVHAGLETSVFGAKYPDMEMISVGPTIQNVHSPDERLETESVGMIYDLLVATLQRVPARKAG